MSWLSDLGHSISEGWKDLTDPGRHDRERYTNSLSSLQKKSDEERSNMVKYAKALNSLDAGALGAYVNSLRNAPNVIYNQGVSGLQREAQGRQNILNKQMANRGLSANGIDIGAMLKNQSLLSKGISALQGQRIQNMANNNGRAWQAMLQNNNNAFNRSYNAMNYSMPIDNATANQLNYYQQRGNRGSAFNNLLSTAISGWATGGLGSGLTGLVGSAGGNYLGNYLSNKGTANSVMNAAMGSMGVPGYNMYLY